MKGGEELKENNIVLGSRFFLFRVDVNGTIYRSRIKLSSVCVYSRIEIRGASLCSGRWSNRLDALALTYLASTNAFNDRKNLFVILIFICVLTILSHIQSASFQIWSPPFKSIKYPHLQYKKFKNKQHT